MLINIRIKYGAKIGKKVKGRKCERRLSSQATLEEKFTFTVGDH